MGALTSPIFDLPLIIHAGHITIRQGGCLHCACGAHRGIPYRDSGLDRLHSARRTGTTVSLATDVREPKGAEAAFQRVLERFGKLDVLIANAGFISVLVKSEEIDYNYGGP